MALHPAGHRRGVVATPHHAAVEAGRTTLAEGGNALEAMIAMAATIAAVYPHMTQLGGDGFWLVRERSGRVRALVAAGRAGANARRELYRDYETIPPRGALAALTVPAAVAGWMLALEAASAHGGRLRLGDLLAPAIAHAREGAIVTPSHRREARRAQGRARLRADVSARRQAVRGGRDAQAGSARRDARASRPRRARRFLPRRCRSRDCRRSRPRWQLGVARRAGPVPRHARRAALGRARCRPRVQHPAADAGLGVVDHSRAVRALARSRW